ncbi:TetR/AcrR family transcriptional regulator [Streptomyces sp. KLOTTS4A1]|uniref:TetR/AcrR family transcriptional regulator n=1 Tax=Streptomyces sp. KLOTTS4A1 TaxID=3390996 RepID=UPI0039F5E1F1
MSPRKAAALPDGGNLRDHLIATAERVIAERGTVGLTVRAIAREAAVADGVLYNHFADKEELLAHALSAHVRKAEQGLGSLPEPGTGTVEDNLKAYAVYGFALHRAILPALTGFVAQPKVLARFAERRETGEEWRDRLGGYLRAERDLGRLPSDARTDAAARVIVGACHETVISALFDERIPAQPAPEAVDELVAVVMRGIAGTAAG